MRKVFIKIFLLLGFSVLSCNILYSAEDNNKSQSQSSQVSDKKSSQTLEQTSLRPILPPVVPSPLPSISPMPSPNIAIPPITPDTMDVQRINQINADNQLRKPQAAGIPTLPSLPKLPTLPPSTIAAKSIPSVPILPQKIQLIKGLLGTVVNIGSEKGEILWLDVKDRFSDETVRINVDSKKTRVIKKDVLPLVLEDIKVGDMVRVIFNQAGKKIPVNVISIINEEDLKTDTQPK
nr:hypothetical protein [Candidatus Omnitrophota bacterium]